MKEKKLSKFEKDLKKIKSDIIIIAEILKKGNKFLLEALNDCSCKKFDKVKSTLCNIGEQTDKIDNDIINFLALYTPKAKDVKELISYLKITNELSLIFATTKELIIGFSNLCNEVDIETIKEYSIPMQTSTLKALSASIEMISCKDNDELDDLYRNVLIQENITYDWYEVIQKKFFTQTKNQDNFNQLHEILKVLRKSSKIASKSLDIANIL